MKTFTPVPNFDSLSPQTTKGDLISRTTTTAVRVGVGSDNTVLTADSSQASGVKWATASANMAVNTLAGATTLPASSQILLVSGTTFAITLPSATSNSGLYYKIYKTDTILTPISITGTGFIGLTLGTLNEEVGIVCDGTTFWPIEHKTATKPIAFTPSTGGQGSITGATYFWFRTENFCNVYGYSVNGTVGASLWYSSLPSPLTMDAALLAPGGNTTTQDGQIIGNMVSEGGTNDWGFILTAPGTSTTIVYCGPSPASNGAALKPTNGNSFNSTNGQSVWYRIPIAGWSA